MRVVACLALLAFLAGCTSPFAGEGPPGAESPRAVLPPPAPSYGLTVLVTADVPDGAPLAGAEVVAYVLDSAGEGLTGVSVPAATDGQGVARFSFREPTRLALRATLPGWTQEGTTVAVGEQVVVGDGLVASDRDVFVPLFRSLLRLEGTLTLATSTVAADGMGNLVHPQATIDLALPDRAQAAYLERLSSADVRLTWTETPTEHADLAAGLAWDGRPWVAGEAAGPGLLPGDRSATFSGPVPGEGRPMDLAAATLQAVAITQTAVIGDVPLGVAVELRFDGRTPPGLPGPCHALLC